MTDTRRYPNERNDPYGSLFIYLTNAYVIDHKVITEARKLLDLLGKIVIGDLHVGGEVFEHPVV